MQSTFELEDSIVLVADGKHLDLHNCYDFIVYEYRPTERHTLLRWNRGIGEWIADTLPAGLSLIFSGVTNFAVQKRDDEMPFTEDNCVASISFLPAALDNHFDVICLGERFGDEHLSLRFQSGAGLKIWAESVRHEFTENVVRS